MNMLYVLLVLSLALIGCGKPHDGYKADEVAPYVVSYLALAAEYGMPASEERLEAGSIRLVDSLDVDDPSILAICQGKNARYWRILIRKDVWAKANDTERKLLMYHELAHCVHGMDHRGERDGFSVTSIMYPNMLPAEFYLKQQKAFDRELFTRLFIKE
jgi:hypothetical protein